MHAGHSFPKRPEKSGLFFCAGYCCQPAGPSPKGVSAARIQESGGAGVWVLASGLGFAVVVFREEPFCETDFVSLAAFRVLATGRDPVTLTVSAERRWFCR
jgi:hypothetical protein